MRDCAGQEIAVRWQERVSAEPMDSQERRRQERRVDQCTGLP